MNNSAKNIRKQFLDYFQNKESLIVPSAPIVVHNDPTLMFTNAGMNPFKDIFLGLKEPASPRIADTQKCLRVSGKHNDLDEVGHDTYHHTMFEMLGNWSFGNYYKKETIEWAWDLLTNVYKIEKDRLFVTIFEGDKEDGLPEDVEAYNEWKKWIAEDRILRASKKDNFWEMGDTGPCGPCSEIHVDVRSDEDRTNVDGNTLVNQDHPEVVEIWNLVFMAFNRKADSSLEELPNKSVDTGMGFERLCMVLQGVKSNYDTDVFKPYIDFMENELGCDYAKNEKESIAMRVVMDHIRAICLTIADGAIPSNTGSGYVIRRILRRASRYGFQYLGQHRPFLFRLVDVVADFYRGVFEEVSKQKDHIRRIVKEEEKAFLRTLERGTGIFEAYVSKNDGKTTDFDADFTWDLYQTFGFPSDLTEVMAREIGWTVDNEGFKKRKKEEQERGKKDSKQEVGDWTVIARQHDLPEFIGYDQEEAEVTILQYRSIKKKKDTLYQVVLNCTPFYAESGGQVADKGTISNGNETLKVFDTQKENDLIVHFVSELPKDSSGTWKATVNGERRRLIRANHSATHLMHEALREVLGSHVEQRGSLVNDKLLRFDFSHYEKLTSEEISKVEAIVNAQITKQVPLMEMRGVPMAKAKEMGAMAVFGENYKDEVRVIVFDPEFSVELCGGTHVQNTSEIRLFKLVSESSIAAGIRRVEALTADGALQYLVNRSNTLQSIAQRIAQKDLVKAIDDLMKKNRDLEKKIEEMGAKAVADLHDDLKSKSKPVDGMNLINEVVSVNSAKDLKSLCFSLRNSLEHTLIVLGAVVNEKPMLNVILTEDLQKSGKYNATELVRALATEIQGGGGGQDFFASAGGKKADGVPDAVKKAEEMI